MPNLLDITKKLAARITTANGDISAVPGDDFADVLDFMVNNLNTNGSSDGYLKTSKIIDTSKVLATVPYSSGSIYHKLDEPFWMPPEGTGGKNIFVTFSFDGVAYGVQGYMSATNVGGTTGYSTTLSGVYNGYNIQILFNYHKDSGNNVSGGAMVILDLQANIPFESFKIHKVEIVA